MPTSPFGHIETFVDFLNQSRPRSLLDIGMGNGKLGFIARDFLDVMLNEAYHRSRWKVRIDGIEAYADYIQDHQRAVYDTIHIGDAFDVIDRLGPYDMIVLGDVLEHFEKERAWEFFDKCIRHAEEHLAVFIPLGKTWQQPAIYGNPYEAHRSSWFFDELECFSECHALFDYEAGPYGGFLVKRDAYLDFRVKRFLTPDTPKDQHQHPLCRRLDISKETLDRIDLNALARHMADRGHLPCFLDTEFKEHYRLIAHLSTRFNGASLFDIGTSKGYSALALSYNPANFVVSYDIVDCKELRFPEQLGRLEYRIGDVLKDPRLLASPLIMLDTDHDGVFENEFYAFLKKNNYRGWLFLDDIHLNPAMIRFWHGITELKVDLTDLGHFTGSGMVAFGSV
jgi:hypothetical protein